MMRHLSLSMAIVTVLTLSSSARAEMSLLFDFAQWQSQAGSVTTIDFTGFPQFTIITNQYSDLGVIFTQGNDFVHNDPSQFPLDGWGLDGNNNSTIAMTFTTPQYAFATHFGSIQYQLFSNGQLIYQSPPMGVGVSLFAGVISTVPFDSVVLFDPLDTISVQIDNLYFAPGIPAPPAFMLLGAAGLCVHRRRRC
jgi:hypothetical protein